jgi:Big-like domain-containing protein
MISIRFVVACALLLVSSLASAQVPTVTPTPGDSPLQSISLVPDATKDKKISVGEFAPFTATGHYQNGAEKNLTQQVNYTSSDPTVAEAPNTPGNKGRVNGIAPGVVTITATDPVTNISSDDPGGVNGQLTVQGALVSITLKPLDKNAAVGDNIQYTATGQLSDGNTKNLTQKVVYSSSNTSVAVCPNADGNKSLVQAVGVGTATISATDPVTQISTQADGRSTLTVRAAGSTPGAGTPTPRPTSGVCGDPDATGTVTVSDGVQVLDAAAGLASKCSAAVCDVDNSGAVTVTDGVLVLRNAAGLDGGLHCP